MGQKIAIQRASAVVLFMVLAGCASRQAVVPEPGKDAAMSQRVGDAFIAPLDDLNLSRVAIPDVLLDALAAPYASAVDASCTKLIESVRALDVVLGADLDTPASETNPSLLERGMGAAGNASVSALRSTTEGMVPFRGWVRKLTGAERHSRKVAAAITAGSIRRAYLKGMGQARGCELPAAPVLAPPAASAAAALPASAASR